MHGWYFQRIHMSPHYDCNYHTISSMRIKYFTSPTLNAVDTNTNNSHR